MSHDKQTPESSSYEETAEFWDTYSLADPWEQAEQAEFEISEQARKRECEGWDGEA
jgi:hypothetical protein